MAANPILAYGRWLAESSARWPQAAIELAHNAFIDTIGVAIRGTAEEAPRRVFTAIGAWGDDGCAVVGRGTRLSPPLAALANATSAHALDFDDHFDPGKAHASAVLAPAILALAEPRENSGRDCLDAYIAGLQILGRVGQGLNPLHRNRGWHATGTVGAIGAAAACARLLRLDPQQAAYALSIATSMAGGFMSQFGTMTKPIHAGLAAQAGVIAASFAQRGIDAGVATLDGATGMAGLMIGPDFDRFGERGFTTDRIDEPLMILDPGLKVKRFPNCASAHRAMDALLELKSRHRFTASDVDTVAVRAPRPHLQNLMYEYPDNPLQAKFSLEFALAVILIHGDCRLAHFNEEMVSDQDLRALYPRIRREPVDDAEGGVRTDVEVALKDGRAFATAVSNAVGSPTRRFATEDLWAKFDGCVSDVLPAEQADKVRDLLGRLPDLESVAPLMREL